jgi:hypothetical protein
MLQTNQIKSISQYAIEYIVILKLHKHGTECHATFVLFEVADGYCQRLIKLLFKRKRTSLVGAISFPWNGHNKKKKGFRYYSR